MAAFRSAGSVGQESPEKLALLREIEEMEDPRATDSLIAIAADPDEYDLARIGALRALEIRSMGRVERELVARALDKILREDEDPDVRIHAAITLDNVMDIPVARDAAARSVLDPEEDVDVRHNAFFAIERGGASPKAIEVMKKCLSDEEFRGGAARVLEQWGRAQR